MQSVQYKSDNNVNVNTMLANASPMSSFETIERHTGYWSIRLRKPENRFLRQKPLRVLFPGDLRVATIPHHDRDCRVSLASRRLGEDMHQPLHWLRGDFDYGKNLTVVIRGQDCWCWCCEKAEQTDGNRLVPPTKGRCGGQADGVRVRV